MKFKPVNAVFSVLLAGSLIFGSVPAASFADEVSDLQSKLDTVQSTLNQYSAELEMAKNDLYQLQTDLNSLSSEIEQTQADIDQKEQELKEGQAELSERLSETYKQGGTSGVVSFIVGTTSFEDLTLRMFYADQVADRDAELLDSVRSTKAELTEKQNQLKEDKEKQEQLVADQQSKTNEIQQKVNEQTEYYNGLDSQLQAELERQAEEQRIAAEQAAAAAQQQQQNANSSDGDGSTSNNGGGNANQSGNANSQNNNNSHNNTNNNGGGSSNAGGNNNTNSGNAPAGVVSVALAQVGKSYVYGAGGPNSFDCSGLTSYAYAQCGISIPHSSGAQYDLVRSKGHLVTSTSALKAGDLVFWASGGRIYHVAIYIGGGQVVHAMNPAMGVRVTSLDTGSGYVGGGSPV